VQTEQKTKTYPCFFLYTAFVLKEYGIRYEGVWLLKGAKAAFDGGEDVFRRVEERFSFIFSARYVYFWREPKIFTAPAKNVFSAR